AIIGRLADRLKSPSPSVRQAAQDVLVDVGAAAVPALVARLHRKGGPVVKARVAEVLGLVGRRLDDCERTEVFFELEIAMGTAKDRAGGEAGAKALAGFCPGILGGDRVDPALVPGRPAVRQLGERKAPESTNTSG